MTRALRRILADQRISDSDFLNEKKDLPSSFGNDHLSPQFMELAPQLHVVQINPRLIRVPVVIRIILDAGLHRRVQLSLRLLVVLVK